MKNFFFIFLCCSFAWTIQAQNMDKMSIYELDSLANYWQGEGKYDKALSFAKKAIEIAKKEKNDSLNNCLFRLGRIYTDMNETEKAEEILNCKK
jgi:tetratricopeptide (TPR) repeat protein